jgi:hypothetical protein
LDDVSAMMATTPTPPMTTMDEWMSQPVEMEVGPAKMMIEMQMISLASG